VVAPGDYNQDMTVDADDYIAWRSAFGTRDSGLHTGAFADGNGNGVVDTADYVIWRKNVGQIGPGTGSLSESSTVPEPATIFLFAAGIGLVFLRRRMRVAR
jgi:hypothetical protein